MTDKRLDLTPERRRKCFSCRFFAESWESWEMPNIRYYECRKRPSNENLKSFPFKNGCKRFKRKARS